MFMGGVFAAKTNHVHVSFEIPVCTERVTKYKKGKNVQSTRRGLIMQAQDDACPITALLARASLTRSMSSVGARSTCFDTLTSTYVESNTC